LIAPVALLLINSTAAQDADAMSRWGEKIGDVLVTSCQMRRLSADRSSMSSTKT